MDFYVVCLTKNEARLKAADVIRSVIPQLKVVDAVDGHQFTLKDIRDLQKEGSLPEDSRLVDNMVAPPDRGRRPFKVGEVGAFLSHRKAIREVAEGNADAAVIFEDDTIPDVRFKEKLDVILQHVPEDADIVHLYVFPSQKKYLPDKPGIVMTPNGLFGLQCYYITKKGAKFAMEKLKTMHGAIDEMITRIGLFSYCAVGIELVENIGYFSEKVIIPSQVQEPKYVKDLIQ